MRRFFCAYRKIIGSNSAAFTVPLSQDFELEKIIVKENDAATLGGGVFIDIEQAGSGTHHNDKSFIPSGILQAVKKVSGNVDFIGRSTSLKNIKIVAGDSLIINIDSKNIAGAEVELCIVGYKVKHD